MIQKDPLLASLEQWSQNIMTILVMVMVILLIQFWLLSIALEEFMAAENALALPTFAASCVCLAINIWLLKYVRDIDKKIDKH